MTLSCIVAKRHKNIPCFLYIYDTTVHPLTKLNTAITSSLFVVAT
jgi:hypothetical protein